MSPERFLPSECQRCHDKPVSIPSWLSHSTTATASSISARQTRAVPSSRPQGSTAGSAPSPPGLQGCEQLPPAAPALVQVTTFLEHTPEGVPGARDSRFPARSCCETRSAAPRIRADAGPRAKSPRFSDKLCLLPARDCLGKEAPRLSSARHTQRGLGPCPHTGLGRFS